MVTVNGKELMAQLARSSNDLGETPLILAVKRNHEEMVKFLVEELDALAKQEDLFGKELITNQSRHCLLQYLPNTQTRCQSSSS